MTLRPPPPPPPPPETDETSKYLKRILNLPGTDEQKLDLLRTWVGIELDG